MERARVMRSDLIKKGAERAPHRSLLKATGNFTDADGDKPFIAVVNSYVDIIPGHAHLDKVGYFIKGQVRAAGGVPFIFNTIGIDDGIAMGHAGMKFSLPSRELIADSVETMVTAHPFDGMVCIPNCDKIVPGMLMAALRVNIPAIFVSGGAMAAGRTPIAVVGNVSHPSPTRSTAPTLGCPANPSNTRRVWARSSPIWEQPCSCVSATTCGKSRPIRSTTALAHWTVARTRTWLRTPTRPSRRR